MGEGRLAKSNLDLLATSSAASDTSPRRHVGAACHWRTADGALNRLPELNERLLSISGHCERQKSDPHQ